MEGTGCQHPGPSPLCGATPPPPPTPMLGVWGRGPAERSRRRDVIPLSPPAAELGEAGESGDPGDDGAVPAGSTLGGLPPRPGEG